MPKSAPPTTERGDQRALVRASSYAFSRSVCVAFATAITSLALAARWDPSSEPRADRTRSNRSVSDRSTLSVAIHSSRIMDVLHNCRSASSGRESEHRVSSICSALTLAPVFRVRVTTKCPFRYRRQMLLSRSIHLACPCHATRDSRTSFLMRLSLSAYLFIDPVRANSIASNKVLLPTPVATAYHRETRAEFNTDFVLKTTEPGYFYIVQSQGDTSNMWATSLAAVSDRNAVTASDDASLSRTLRRSSKSVTPNDGRACTDVSGSRTCSTSLLVRMPPRAIFRVRAKFSSRRSIARCRDGFCVIG